MTPETSSDAVPLVTPLETGDHTGWLLISNGIGRSLIFVFAYRIAERMTVHVATSTEDGLIPRGVRLLSVDDLEGYPNRVWEVDGLELGAPTLPNAVGPDSSQ